MRGLVGLATIALMVPGHAALPDTTEEAARQNADFTLFVFGVLTGLIVEQSVAAEANTGWHRHGPDYSSPH